MHILKVDGITKNYGKKCVVNALNLYVTTGEIVRAARPNGARQDNNILYDCRDDKA